MTTFAAIVRAWNPRTLNRWRVGRTCFGGPVPPRWPRVSNTASKATHWSPATWSTLRGDSGGASSAHAPRTRRAETHRGEGRIIGTNYYHRPGPCGECGRGEEVHIGKSSGGWTFSFHGTEEIRSWQDWQERLRAGGKIFNEYDKEVPFEEFVNLVESKKGMPNNHTTYCRVNHPEYARDCWLDDEGNSFSSGEFS